MKNFLLPFTAGGLLTAIVYLFQGEFAHSLVSLGTVALLAGAIFLMSKIPIRILLITTLLLAGLIAASTQPKKAVTQESPAETIRAAVQGDFSISDTGSSIWLSPDETNSCLRVDGRRLRQAYEEIFLFREDGALIFFRVPSKHFELCEIAILFQR